MVPGGRGGPGGDALTRASAVDHVRYTRPRPAGRRCRARWPPGALYAVEHDYLSSAVEAAAGDVSYARALALGAARGIGTGHVAYAIFALYEAARHGGAPAAAELLAELPATEGRLLPALVAAVEALARRSGERLEAVAGCLEELGRLLHAAELTGRPPRWRPARGGRRRRPCCDPRPPARRAVRRPPPSACGARAGPG